MKERPWQFASIPIAAGAVGYVTNLVGVNMLFYPIDYLGFNFKRWKENPFGILGWQGIVPCKRVAMATTCVDVTLTRLLTIEEVFSRLDARQMAVILSPELKKVILGGIAPLPIVEYFVEQVASEAINSIEKLVSCRDIMIHGMTDDPRTLGNFFQKVGEKELTFLVQSGTYFGFLLGLGQMAQLMVFPALWTLPVCGAVVGLLTNWIAIRLIFNPVKPVEIGDYRIQGLFLKRQREVSAEVSSYLASEVLTSQDIWREVLTGPNKTQFADIIRHQMPFLTESMVAAVVGSLEEQLLLHAAKAPSISTITNLAKQPHGLAKDGPKLKAAHIDIPGLDLDVTVIIPPPIIDPHPAVLEVVTKTKPQETGTAAVESAAQQHEQNEPSQGAAHTPLSGVKIAFSSLMAPILPEALGLSTNTGTGAGTGVVTNAPLNIHPLHSYINETLQVEATLIDRLELLSAVEFERLLHPIFEEDEITLILAGGVLGATAGAIQWWLNVFIDGKLQGRSKSMSTGNWSGGGVSGVRMAATVARKAILRR